MYRTVPFKICIKTVVKKSFLILQSYCWKMLQHYGDNYPSKTALNWIKRSILKAFHQQIACILNNFLLKCQLKELERFAFFVLKNIYCVLVYG